MTDYRPVDCAFYARLELAVLRREPVMLCWRDASDLAHLEPARPMDLETRAGEEFLHFRTAAGRAAHTRLDRIVEFRSARGARRG